MTSIERLMASAAVALSVAAFPSAAAAQTDATAARALFNEARALAEKGEHAAACPKFEESMRLRPGEGTRFNLADCWEKIGRTASAWGEFLEVASSSKNSGKKDREALARRRADALEPKLSRLIILVSVAESELSVMRDGVEVRNGTWGTPVPVDPGRHSITAHAPGKSAWSTEIDINGTAPVTVNIPRLESQKSAGSKGKSKDERDSADEGARKGNAESAFDEAESAEKVEIDTSGDDTRRALVYVAGGAGVALFVLGTIFYFDFKSKNGDAAGMCRSANDCNLREIGEHNDLVDRAQTSRTLSYLSFGAGALALGGATVLYLTSEPAPIASGRNFRLSPLIGSGVTGLTASGRF